MLLALRSLWEASSSTKAIAPTLAGTSSLSATVTPYQRVTVTLAGTSSLAATVTPYQRFTVTLAGTSTLSTTVIPLHRFTVTLAGTSSLAATVTPYQRITASHSGNGRADRIGDAVPADSAHPRRDKLTERDSCPLPADRGRFRRNVQLGSLADTPTADQRGPGGHRLPLSRL